MKILICGIGNQSDMTNAFNSIGDILYFDWTKYPKQFNSSIEYLVETHQPDIIFMQIQTPGIISVETAKKISEKAIVINWSGDVRQDLIWYLEIGKHIHLTLFTNMHDVELCRKNRVSADYLQIGFPNLIFTPDGPVKPNVPEIVFMANNIGGFPLSKLRMDMVNALKLRYSSRFGYYGINWGKGIFPIKTQQEEASYYRGAKIAINLSHFNYSRYSSDRLLRAMGAGCFVLSHNYKDHEKEFVSGQHFDTWKDFKELFIKIDYYLLHPQERKQIAQQGCIEVHLKHKWENRVGQLIKMLAGYSSKTLGYESKNMNLPITNPI